MHTLNSESHPLEFVEQYYPNYWKAQEITYADCLNRIVDNEYLEDYSGALVVFEEIKTDINELFPDLDEETLNAKTFDEAENRLNKIDKNIYKKAIEEYLKTL